MLLGAELVVCVTDWLLRLLPSLVLRQFTTELLADARETHKMLLLIPRVNSRRESVGSMPACVFTAKIYLYFLINKLVH